MSAADVEAAPSESSQGLQNAAAETEALSTTLTIDPFGAESGCFYPGAGRQRLLEQLLHYCQFSASLLVVLGEAGSGKSHSCHSLADKARAEATNNYVCTLDVPVLCNPEQLLTDIARCFGLAAKGEVAQILTDLRHFGQAPEERESLALILIDNAHNLDDQALDALISLLQGQEGCSRRLHVVMFAEPGLEVRLERLELGDVLIHDLHLPTLAQEEVADYIDFRLEQAGVDLDATDNPFDEQVAARIWRQSAGNIEAINRLGRQQLEKLLEEPQPTSLFGRSSGLPLGHMLAAVVLASALLLLLLYRDEWSGTGAVEPAVDKTVSITLPGRPIQAGKVGGDESLIPPVSMPAPFEPEADLSEGAPSAQVTMEPAAVEWLSEPPLPPQSAPKEPSPEVSLPEDPVSLEMELAKMVEAPAPELPKVESPAATVEKVKSDAAAARSQATQVVTMAESHRRSAPQSIGAVSLSVAEEQLLGRPAGRYVLQILGAGTEKSVREFMQRQANREALMLYTTRRKGRDWYVVVVGDYATIAEARRAIAELPASQRGAGPWPRKLQAVQTEIRSFRGM